MSRPLKAVTAALVRSGRGSLLGPDTNRRVRWWELTLDCGHRVERPVRYRPRPAAEKGLPRPRVDVPPAPAQARCDTYPTEAHPGRTDA